MKAKTKNTMILNKKITLTILWLKSKIFKRTSKNLNSRIYQILKIYMQRLFNKNSNLTKNPQQIITTKDGFGCNSLGFA